MVLTGITASTNGLSFNATTWTAFYTNGTGANVALTQLNVSCIYAAGCSVAFTLYDGSTNAVMPVLPLQTLSENAGVNLQPLINIPDGYVLKIYCSVASASSPIVAGATLIGGMF